MPLVLGALPAAMAGLFAVLLLFGVILLIDILLRSIDLSGAPAFITNGIKAVVVTIGRAVQWITSLLVNMARTAMSIFTSPALGFIALADMTAVAFSRLGSWVRYLVHTEVPNLWRGLIGTVASAVANLSSMMNQLFAQAIGYANNLFNVVSRALSVAIANVSAYALSLFNIAMNAVARAIATVSAYALAVTTALGAVLGLRIDALTNYVVHTAAQLAAYSNALAQWAMNTAYGAATDWAKKYSDELVRLYDRAVAGAGALAMAPAWPAALDAIDAISLAIPAGIAAALARVGAIPRVVPRDIAAQIGAIAAVGSIAVDFVAKCGLDLCRNSKPFGNDWAMLEDAAIIALLFDLIAEGAHNPHGTATVIHDEITAPLTAISHQFAQLIA